MRIGELGEHLGVETHVLRHWEDAGLLAPRRTTAGYREYDAEQIVRACVVVRCRSAGLPLQVIAALLHRDAAGRAVALADELEHTRRQQQRLAETAAFLTHVADCRHPEMHRCPECSAFASPPA